MIISENESIKVYPFIYNIGSCVQCVLPMRMDRLVYFRSQLNWKSMVMSYWKR